MDLQTILEGGSYYRPNPNYNNKTKKLGVPEFIPTTDPRFDITESLTDVVTRTPLNQPINMGPYSAEQLADYGLTPTNVTKSLQNELADAQSNWSKTWHSLEQAIVVEAGLGIAKGFSDIGDAVINGIGSALFNTTNDYTNPISELFEKAQEKMRNDLAPIYTHEGVDISNGGFTSLEWYAANFPSVATSISLMIPGRMIQGGISKLARLFTKGRATAKALGAISKATGAEKIATTPAIMATKAGMNQFGTAVFMRAAENYQEARGVYTQMNDEAYGHLVGMNDKQYAEWVEAHKDYLEKNKLDPNDKKAIAHRIASDAANTTFREDFSNIGFDLIELMSLRNSGNIFKKVTSPKIQRLNRASISNLNKTTQEIAEATAKSSKFSNLGNKFVDWSKGVKSAVIGELSEGVEEAVNFVAQQEGITVGKTILEDLDPSTFTNRLNQYLVDPQLWESAFWGLAGGVVFQGLGSAYNTAEFNYKVKKERAGRKNDKTGEEPNPKFYELEDLPEVKKALRTIENRTRYYEDTVNKLSDINNGLNIFAERDKDTKELPKFEGSPEVIRAQQEEAREFVINQFIANVTTEAIHSGTYDLLKEFLSSPEFAKSLVDKGIASASDISSFANRIIKQADFIRDTYNKQLSHVMQQTGALNASGKYKDPVPLVYVQLVAKQNLDRILDDYVIDSRIARFREQIDRLKDNPALEGHLNGSINYENFMTAQAITNQYIKAETAKKLIDRDDNKSSLEKVMAKYNHIETQKKLLEELGNITTISEKSSSPLGRILATIRTANDFISDETGVLKEDIDAADKTDKELLSAAGFEATDNDIIDAIESYNLHDVPAREAMAELRKATEQDTKDASDALKQLKEVSEALYIAYENLGYARAHKAINASSIATTKEQIRNAIDLVHNQNNINRLNMIRKASDMLDVLYNKYDRKTIDDLIATYVDGRPDTTKVKAREVLTKDAQDVSSFIDALDILNLHTDNNAQLAFYITQLINGKEEIKRKSAKSDDVEEKTTTSENEISDEETSQTDNLSQTDMDDSSEDEKRQNEPLTNLDTQETETLLNRGRTLLNADDDSLTDAERQELEDINVELDRRGVNLERSTPPPTSSTGGIDDEHRADMQVYKDKIDEVFEYLNITAEDDLQEGKDFNVEDAANALNEEAEKYITNLEITDEAKDELRSIVQDRAEDLKKHVNAIKEVLNKENPTLDEAAAGLAMASKIGILDNKDTLPNIFVVGFEKFVDTYMQTAITPIKDGKKVISIDEILEICNNAIGDNNAGAFVLDKLKQYLSSPEIADKYFILDGDTLKKDYAVANKAKDTKDIEHQRDAFRVNLLDYVDFYNSVDDNDALLQRDKKNFFRVVDSLKKGSTLKLAVDGNTIFVKYNNLVIGTIRKADFVDNKFVQYSKNWIEDVTINAGGDVSSNAAELYKQIFTSDEPEFVELRNILLDAVANKQPSDKNIADFINSAFISAAIKAKGGGIFTGEMNKDRAKNMINHLISIYNYVTQGVTFKSKEERIEKLVNNVDNYFANLYHDLNVLHRINTDTKVRIEYINDGQEDTLFDDGKDVVYEKLPYLDRKILKSKGKLSVFDVRVNNGTTFVSGESAPDNPINSSRTTKLLALYDRNDKVSWIKIEQLRPSEYTTHSTLVNKIMPKVSLELKDRLSKVGEIKTIEEFMKFASFMKDLVYNKNITAGSIPLFVGFAGKGGNYSYHADTNSFEIYFGGYNSKTDKPIKIKFKFDPTSKTVTYTGNHALTNDVHTYNSTQESFASNAVNDLLEIIKNNTVINIEPNGIRSDNAPNVDINSGFIQRKNGKIEAFGETYNSYNDFIIDNGLAKVNLRQPTHGTNFRGRSTKQILNQSMYVSVATQSTSPVEDVDNEKYEVSKPTTAFSQDILQGVVDAFTKEQTSGKDLFIAAFGDEAYQKLIDISKEFDIAEEIFPESLKYHPKLNSAKNSTLEAKTNPTLGTIRVNIGSDTTASGRTRVELKPGETLVGSKFIQLISSNKSAYRNRAVAVMIHERLHWLIRNNPNYTRQQILDAITPIYNDFFKLCQDYVNDYESNKVERNKDNNLKYRRAVKAINDFKKYDNTKTYPDPLTKFDEFLVESITNVDYNALLNQFDEITPSIEGKQNIFTRLINFVMEYLFGRKVRNGSLLKQEFNALTNILNGKEVNISEEAKTITTIPATDDKTEKKIVRKVRQKITKKSDATRTNKDDFFDGFDSKVGILTDYMDETITGHISSLSLENQAKLQTLIDKDVLKYICVIK